MNLLKNLSVALLAVLAPIKAIMLAALALIVIDLITGLWRAKKTGENITSSGIRRTITKIVAYELALIAGLIMEQYLLGGSMPVIKLVAGLIAMTEGKSVLENLSEITGVDLVKAVMDKIQGSKPEGK